MPKYTSPPITFSVRGIVFTFWPRALDGLPEARAFIDGLLARNASISPAVATYYVKLVARLKRQGRLFDPAGITHRVEKTAANAYWKWVNETYAARTRPVVHALGNTDVTSGIHRLRRGSLVPPFPGKMILRRLLPTPPKPGEGPMPSRVVAEEPCADWTLHVPESDSIGPHTDPCADCVVVKLEPHHVEVIATVFEQVWGHRNLTDVPADQYLFGQPPIVHTNVQNRQHEKRIVALLPEGPHANVIDQLGASVSRDLVTFEQRLRGDEIADTIVVDFASVLPNETSQLTQSIGAAALRWHEAHSTKRAAPTLFPIGGVPLPGTPDTKPPIADVPLESPLAGSGPVPLPIAPIDPGSEPFVPMNWEAVAQAHATKLVYCTVHHTEHSVQVDAPPCGEKAWTEIRV